jgi:hypothetical protein
MTWWGMARLISEELKNLKSMMKRKLKTLLGKLFELIIQFIVNMKMHK